MPQVAELVGSFISYKLDQVFNLPDLEDAADNYRSAAPYPHLVIPDFFRRELVDLIRTEIVDVEALSKTFTDDFQARKSISTGDALPPFIQALAGKFASAEMLTYLERLTGLRKLIPDPYYNTEYAYYHITRPGGVLGSHVDHSHHHRLGTPHVLNLVVYLTPEWSDTDGGALCLFNALGKRVMKRIACSFNTAVIFSSSPIAYHGVEPIRGSAGRERHSLYFAYYSIAQPENVPLRANFPSGLSAGTSEPTEVVHATYFVVPVHKLFYPRNFRHLRMRVLYLIKLFVPPIITGLIYKFLRRSKK